MSCRESPHTGDFLGLGRNHNTPALSFPSFVSSTLSSPSTPKPFSFFKQIYLFLPPTPPPLSYFSQSLKHTGSQFDFF
jgi:hypothetical protein